jgi:heme-degrading monooxygenase HmoA
MTTIFETASFNTNPGVTEENVLAVQAGVLAFLKSQTGFMSHRLTRDADGRYHDHVEWRTKADAEAAQQAFMQNDACLALVALIDHASLHMAHRPILWAA